MIRTERQRNHDDARRDRRGGPYFAPVVTLASLAALFSAAAVHAETSLQDRLSAQVPDAVSRTPIALAPHAPRADEHVHVPLDVDASLGWPELIDATIAAHPARFELAARSNEAVAWQDRSRRWLADQPSVYFSQLSDGLLDARGQQEYETGIELPLWHSGQRRAVRGVADSVRDEAAAAARALRWQIAGQLREMLWDIAAAGNAVESAEASLAVASELVRVVDRLNAAGDLPETDVLLARSAELSREMAVVEAEALLLDAERGYRSLTGLERRPAQFDEVPAARDTYGENHPLLALAAAEIERSRADLALVERSTRGNPVLTVGPRRQRDALTSYHNDSLGVALSIPIGGDRYGTTERARAARAVAEAETRRAGLERRLDLDLHEAEHTLSVLEESLELAEEQNALANRQWTMSRTAFEAGELALRELLRIQDAAQRAALETRRLRIERSRTIAAMNQALGELP